LQGDGEGLAGQIVTVPGIAVVSDQVGFSAGRQDRKTIFGTTQIPMAISPIFRWGK